MKKIIKTLILTCALVSSTSVFALGRRFVEFGFDLPVGFSNNLLSAGDIFKETIEINLPEIADELEGTGFVLNGHFDPSVSFKLDARLFEFGLKAGIDGSATLNLSDGFFNLLGKGYNYETDDELSFAIGGDVDLFAYSEFKFGLTLKKKTFTVAPSVYVPILHFGATDNTGFTFRNDGDTGDFIASMKALYELNTCADLSALMNGNVDMNDIMSGKGVDVALGFEMPLPVDFLSFITVKANARIPLVSGTLKYSVPVGITIDDTKINAKDFIEGKGMTLPEITTQTDFDNSLEKEMKIARPLKLGVGADATLLRIFKVNAGLGMGVKYPTSSELRQFFPEYNLGGAIDLANIFVVSLDTKYTDQIFTNTFGMRLNFRLLEMDFGVSSQSSSFLKAFDASGIGAYFTVFVGF